MSKRPPIPIKIRRAVLVEAGHRCAVCGVPCPLEQAHIIPWRINPEHRQENLICLCANCHSRADNENWGEEALREYKARPWIIRGGNQPRAKRQAEPPVRITMTVDMEFEEFGSHKANMLRHAVAGLLHIYPDQVKVVSKKKGSTKVTLVLPMTSAEQLIRLHKTHNPELQRHLGLFKIEAIDVEDDLEAEYSTGEIAEPSFALSSPGSLIGTFPAPRFGSPLPQNYEFSRRVWNLTATDLRRLERRARYLSQTFRGPDAIWDSGDLMIETFITALEGGRKWPQGVSFFSYVSDTMEELARRQCRRPPSFVTAA